jgi:uncharacterized protein YqfA (UPF0365 family)
MMMPYMTLENAQRICDTSATEGRTRGDIFRIVDLDVGQIEITDEIALKYGGIIAHRLKAMEFEPNPAEFISMVRQVVSSEIEKTRKVESVINGCIWVAAGLMLMILGFLILCEFGQ